MYFWLLVIPGFLMTLIDEQLVDSEGRLATQGDETLLLVLAIFVLMLVMIWGLACVLVVAKRLLQTKAGRTRTSFRAVRKLARGFIIPLLLTNLLGGCLTLLWGLLLLVPGIWYALATIFASVIVVGENIAYREALNRSKEAVRGHFWPITLRIVAVAALLWLPVVAIRAILVAIGLADETVGLAAVNALDAFLFNGAYLLFMLCLTELYAVRRKELSRFEEVIPDPIEESKESDDAEESEEENLSE